MLETKRERDGDREVLVVSGDLTVGTAASLKEALQQLLHADANAVVRLERASAADVSFLQLLCAAHRAAADRNGTLEVAGADQEPVASLLRSTGFLRHIGCHDSTRRTCLWAEPSVPRGEGG